MVFKDLQDRKEKNKQGIEHLGFHVNSRFCHLDSHEQVVGQFQPQFPHESNQANGFQPGFLGALGFFRVTLEFAIRRHPLYQCCPIEI